VLYFSIFFNFFQFFSIFFNFFQFFSIFFQFFFNFFSIFFNFFSIFFNLFKNIVVWQCLDMRDLCQPITSLHVPVCGQPSEDDMICNWNNEATREECQIGL
jgi:hypothetical protein